MAPRRRGPAPGVPVEGGVGAPLLHVVELTSSGEHQLDPLVQARVAGQIEVVTTEGDPDEVVAQRDRAATSTANAR